MRIQPDLHLPQRVYNSQLGCCYQLSTIETYDLCVYDSGTLLLALCSNQTIIFALSDQHCKTTPVL